MIRLGDIRTVIDARDWQTLWAYAGRAQAGHIEHADSELMHAHCVTSLQAAAMFQGDPAPHVRHLSELLKALRRGVLDPFRDPELAAHIEADAAIATAQLGARFGR